ncbi:MAG: flavin reductase family protein [Candidatus Krumholzibacteriota bacterium]|nr:flavin reductase family protein [Candidatus Krumholzibacteriota bacterium]
MDSKKLQVQTPLILAPVPVVLVACAHEKLGYNLLTIAWCGVDCSSPEMIHVSIRPGRHSYRMIKESGCFTVNVPTVELTRQVDLCGVISGKDGDKFERAGLTAIPASKVEAPLVAECPVNIECELREVLELGVHHMFIGEVVAKQASADLVTDGKLDLTDLPLIVYVNGEYRVLGDVVGRSGFSLK